MIRSFPLIHREEANLIAKTVTMMEEEERGFGWATPSSI